MSRKHPMRTLLTFACVFALGGCTFIADVDSYKADEGCNLEMRLTEFSAHFTGPHRMEFLIVNPSQIEPQGNLASVLVLDPTPAIDFDINVPNAIPNRDHEIRFYADVDSNGIVEPTVAGARQDHTWILTNVCEPQPIPFVHVFTFQDFTEPNPIGEDLTVRMSGIPEAGGAFELRVIVRITPDPTDPSTTIERTIGTYHKPVRENGVDTDADPFLVTIPGIVDAGVDYTLEAWADGNGNGLFDRNDEGPFAGDDDRYWRISVSGTALDDPSTPFEFDADSVAIMGQNDHSGVVVLTPR